MRNPLTWFLGGGLALAGVILLAGASNLGGGSGPQPSSPGNASAVESRIRLVAYQGADALGGTEVDLGAVVGKGKPVVLNFFAGLCPPCRAEMPGFANVFLRHRSEILIIGADIGPFVGLGSHDDAKRLLSDLAIPYPAGYVVDNPVSTIRITGMPTTIVFDGQGKVVLRRSGFLTEGELEESIQSLIALK